MSCVVDHLSSDHLVRVISRFRDAGGRTHEAGESGVIRRIALDYAAREIAIEWDRDGGGREAMRFRLDAKEGPRNGAMKEYFEVVEYSPLPRPPRPAPSPPDPQPVIRAPLPDWEAAAANVWALAARWRFEEAREQLLAILGAGVDPRLLAEKIGEAAQAHAFDADPAVYDWLKEWCINLWYQWGSGATSGGEGTARRMEMDVAERRFEELERQRLAVRSQGSVRA